jgi:hypothetical protein
MITPPLSICASCALIENGVVDVPLGESTDEADGEAALTCGWLLQFTPFLPSCVFGSIFVVRSALTFTYDSSSRPVGFRAAVGLFDAVDAVESAEEMVAVGVILSADMEVA